jgi:two-component system sensor histidine kinase KdpD
MASSYSPTCRVEAHVPALRHRHYAAIPGRHRQARHLTWLPGLLCLAGLGACTWLSFGVGQSFAFTGFLYLFLVVLAAMYGGFWQATLISVAAVACLDYFFIPPIFSFSNSPANWVALGAFEFTALMIGRLSLRAQSQAMEAIAGRRDMERLYESSRRILLLESSSEQGTLIVLLIQDVFGLDAVHLLDALSGATYQCGEGPPQAEERTRNALALGADTFDPDTRTSYCVLHQGGRPVGGLALCDTSMNQLAATALASLCGIALERARALQRESRAEATRQTEQLRTAVLDALAHQFKTPLTVARAASSGLLAVGGLSDLQMDLVTVLDKQARILEHLASGLLGAVRMDSAEFRPQREPLLLSELVGAVIQKIEPDTNRDRFHVSAAREEAPVLADRELTLTALDQIVDNALKYSAPGCPIYAAIEAKGAHVMLTVQSRGPVVTPTDCERIFERFYRTADTHHLPAGTGLGLSIVKKIVEAHNGSVWAEGKTGYGTSFSITLPAARAC